MSYRVIIACKSTGTGCRERRCNSVEEVHSAAHKKYGLDYCKSYINRVQEHCVVTQLRHSFFDFGACRFRLHKVDTGVAAKLWDKREQEYNNAHTTQKMAERTPEQHTFVERLDILQNSSAGGGKAGNTLEQRVDIAGNLTAHPERKRSDSGQQNPAQRGCGKAVAA